MVYWLRQQLGQCYRRVWQGQPSWEAPTPRIMVRTGPQHSHTISVAMALITRPYRVATTHHESVLPTPFKLYQLISLHICSVCKILKNSISTHVILLNCKKALGMNNYTLFTLIIIDIIS